MSLRLYFDHHVPRAIAVGAQQRGVDVLTAEADGTADRDDEFLLQRATALGRVVFTQDRDFLVLAAAWQQTRREFAGMVYAHQLRITIGGAIHDLALIALIMNPDEMRNQVEFLPLRSDSSSTEPTRRRVPPVWRRPSWCGASGQQSIRVGWSGLGQKNNLASDGFRTLVSPMSPGCCSS